MANIDYTKIKTLLVDDVALLVGEQISVAAMRQYDLGGHQQTAFPPKVGDIGDKEDIGDKSTSPLSPRSPLSPSSPRSPPCNRTFPGSTSDSYFRLFSIDAIFAFHGRAACPHAAAARCGQRALLAHRLFTD